MTVTIDHRPTLGSLAGAMVAVSGVLVVLILVDAQAAVPAAVALPLALFAGLYHSTLARTLTVVTLLIALLLAGILDASPAVLLAGAVLTVTAWDLLEHGGSLGDHVGRGGSTGRNELVHGGATLVVGAVLAAGLLVVFTVLPSGWPVFAIILGLLAGVFALLAIEAAR